MRGLLVSGSSTGLLCQTESSGNRFCDWLGLFFFFSDYCNIISDDWIGIPVWLEEWTVTEKGRMLQMADRDNM